MLKLRSLAIGLALLAACGGVADAGFTAPVASFGHGTSLGPVESNAAWLVPNSQTSSANASLYFRTIYVPSDVTAVSLSLANRLYNAGTGASVTLPQVAIGTSAGGDVFASAPTIYTSQVVPGDGTVLTIPTTAVTRGSDGSIVIAFQYPGGGGVTPVAYCPNLWVGHYHSAGSTLYPTPSFNGSDTNPLFQIWVGYLSRKAHYLVLGDSISVGGSLAPLTAGYAAAAWPKLGADKDLAVAVDGRPGGFLSQFADPVTYPYLWDQQSVANVNVVVQLGVNDTGTGTPAATMLSYFEQIASYSRAHGASSVIATTVLPNITSPYGAGANTIRLAYNALLTGGSSSANLVCDIAPSVWDTSNHNALAAAYYSGDGLHPNAAGNAQIEASLQTCLGLSVSPWECGQPVAPMPVVGLLALVALLAVFRRKRRHHA